MKYLVLMQLCDILIKYCDKAYEKNNQIYKEWNTYHYRIKAGRYKSIGSSLRELKRELQNEYDNRLL